MADQFPKGYQLVEGPRFAWSVTQKLGDDFVRWDEVRRGWEEVLRRNPKAVGTMLPDGTFALSINIPTNVVVVYLQYEIDDEAMCVTYLELF